MKYQSCPSCGSSNRGADRKCYNCSAPLNQPQIQSEPTASSTTDVYTPDVNVKVVEKSLGTAFIAVILSTILGASCGYGIEFFELEMPFFLEEILLGLICASGTAFCICKFQDIPEGLILARLIPAAAYGTLVGLCLFCIWWSFDPSAGFTVVGGIAGFCSGIPVAVSFGLMGGESRPLGQLEFLNVIISLGLGMIMAVFIVFDDGDLYGATGVCGLLALVPTVIGGRINLSEMLAYFSDD